MHKILFTDLDGTLLNDEKKITQHTFHAIEKALEKGHRLVITTGRPLLSAQYILEQLPKDMPGCYLIVYNGAMIYDCYNKKILYEKTLHIEDVAYFFQKAKEQKLYIQTYTKEGVLVETPRKELSYYFRNTKMPYTVVTNIAEALVEEPHKFIVIDLESKERLLSFQEEMSDFCGDRIISVFSCDEYLEYCPSGSTKGNSIAYLCEYLGHPIEETIGVGDGENDLSMILATGVGVAMANAKEIVKQHSAYTTQKDNNQDGVAEVIEKFLLADFL